MKEEAGLGNLGASLSRGPEGISLLDDAVYRRWLVGVIAAALCSIPGTKSYPVIVLDAHTVADAILKYQRKESQSELKGQHNAVMDFVEAETERLKKKQEKS